MAKAKRNIGHEILEGLREIKRGQYGRVINTPDVASIREKTGLSQPRFAQLLGVSVRTLQDWEQGRREPSAAAKTLIKIAELASVTPGLAMYALGALVFVLAAIQASFDPREVWSRIDWAEPGARPLQGPR